MIAFKCKMCGGDLSVDDNITIGTCQYCGSTMTLPKSQDQIKANLYNRANHFRLNYEFDKAAGVYESILNQDTQEAEAYWGLVLCKYGVVYVEDPQTKQMVITCHRTQQVSVFSDVDFKAALEHAGPHEMAIYQTEARSIDEIQKQILEISGKETPFDIFICYKEVDEQGQRTRDSVLAQEIYYQLTQSGHKVFFARITLEDKLGDAYEPYIFAALNSAKVMVVVGTKPEYINAVWVKNEWSRFLELIKKGEQKTLIPAYLDMDPYELPDEFSYLQAQDMSKLGFMQDLIRGVHKLIKNSQGDKTESGHQISVQQPLGVQPLLDRAFLCLEDEDFDKADDLLEQVLNIDPRNASAYVGKLMTEIRVPHERELSKSAQPLTNYRNYQRALQFADEAYRQVLESYNNAVLEKLDDRKSLKIYQKALEWQNYSDPSEVTFTRAADLFRSIPGFKDSDRLAEKCAALAEERREKDSKAGVTIAVVLIIFFLVALISIFIAIF